MKMRQGERTLITIRCGGDTALNSKLDAQFAINRIYDFKTVESLKTRS